MKTILIVDDQPGIRLLLEEVFRKEGYHTVLASNGIEALRQADETAPDAVLLDMKIPGMNGIEILKRLKSQKPELPIMMMTAYGELDLIEESVSLGAVRYFTKPFDIFEVRDEVNRVLEN
ncbi:response regulator [Indiicoccus explosivorum]|uniref:response regulator n=1 Tax=Indiicoccus explosivorum TaxID=1917864 RepID=UPI000B44C6B8|nr:response regulator [Indiicoccus explosivorum]